MNHLTSPTIRKVLAVLCKNENCTVRVTSPGKKVGW